MTASQEGQIPARFKDWKALLGPGVVVVDCFALFRTAGWTMELVKPDDQGDDPDELILERVVSCPPGYQPPVIRGIDVHYEEKTSTEYKTVRILPDELVLEVVDRRSAPPATREPPAKLQP